MQTNCRVYRWSGSWINIMLFRATYLSRFQPSTHRKNEQLCGDSLPMYSMQNQTLLSLRGSDLFLVSTHAAVVFPGEGELREPTP